MINRNKLYSAFFSLTLIYLIMTSFELIFFSFVVCPIITTDIHNLLNSYKSKTPQQIDFDPNPMLIANVLNQREYILINNFNFDNYLIIIILIVFLASLLIYLYIKIGIIEKTENTEGVSPNISPNMSFSSNNSGIRSSRSSQRSLSTSQSEYQQNITNYDSVLTRQNTLSAAIKMIYLKHAVRCAISTITCLIVYQIFFYNYGLGFRYIGSSSELIVLFIESIKN